MSNIPQSVTPTGNHNLGYNDNSVNTFDYKCVKCKKEITQLDSCGPGRNWKLYRCRKCSHYHAVGDIPHQLVFDEDTSVFRFTNDHTKTLVSSNEPINTHFNPFKKMNNTTIKIMETHHIEELANRLNNCSSLTNIKGGVQVTSPASQEYSGPDPATIVSHLQTAVEAERNALNGVSIKLTRNPKLDVDSFALQGVLADYEIKDLINSGLMVIAPFTDQKVSSSDGVKRISYGLSSMGYDATLHEDVYFISKDLSAKPIDPKNASLDQYTKAKVHTDETGSYVLVPPHTFVLGRTIEHFKIPNFIIATVTSKSTYARCGIPTIATPIEPGFHGTITLEFINSTEHYNKLYINEGVVQLLFHVSNKPDKNYTESGGKYNGQTDVRAAEV
jgi:dCTP deaminase